MLKSGHRAVAITGKEQDRLVEDFKMFAVGTIRLKPDNWFFISPFINYAEKVYDFKFRPSDVVVMTFPKAGTTWMQEIVWTMRNNPNLNHSQASLPITERCPQIDFDFAIEGTGFPTLAPEYDFHEQFKKLFPEKNINDGIALQTLEMIPDPRTIKTHLPISLLNPKMIEICKVIYVARNPKDVAVSYHHMMKFFSTFGYSGTLDDSVNYFINDKILWGPYWSHMKEAWDLRHHPNLHFVHYEDLKENPKKEIIRIQNFLDVKLTNKQINDIVEYTSFPAMKKRDNLVGEVAKENSKENSGTIVNVEHVKKEGGFFRKGVVGDWKNRLTPDQAKRIDEWTKENVEQFGPDFKYRVSKS